MKLEPDAVKNVTGKPCIVVSVEGEHRLISYSPLHPAMKLRRIIATAETFDELQTWALANGATSVTPEADRTTPPMPPVRVRP